VGAFAVGIFHLMTHAFFKALLFMGAGSVMHSLSGELDMRKMGSLRKYLPSTFKTYFIATLAISGIIPFAGFWSKDEILFRTFESSSPYWAASGKVLWFVGAAAALLTAFYMFRTVFMTFYGKSRMAPEVEAHVHESPPVMTTPLWILAILSIIGGWVAIPGVTHLFGDFLSPVTGGAVHAATEAVHGVPEAAGHASEIASEWSMAIISMIIALVGIGVAFFFYMSRPKMPEQFTTRFPALYKLVYNKYFMDEVYDSTVVQPIKWTSEWILWKIADNILVDGTVNGVAWLIKTFSGRLRRIQTGLVQNYMVVMLLGVLAIMAYLLFY
jgi:NADH-quinone oxidoreductase subunit L